MKYFTISICLFILQSGCKKTNLHNLNPDDHEINFTYKGKHYAYSENLKRSEINVINGFYGTPSVQIDLPEVFSGKIMFEKTGCAYTVPKGKSIRVEQGCILTDMTVLPGNPVDSSQVFLFNSGTLNITSSNCKTTTTTILGVIVPFTRCDVMGSFNLTLKNKNNETIVITNGVVRLKNWMI